MLNSLFKYDLNSRLHNLPTYWVQVYIFAKRRKFPILFRCVHHRNFNIEQDCQKVCLHDLSFRKNRTYISCDYIREFGRRGTIICFQRRSKILVATNLKMMAKRDSCGMMADNTEHGLMCPQETEKVIPRCNTCLTCRCD